jgi:parvulin-like peptidyl-prolyl isomerase
MKARLVHLWKGAALLGLAGFVGCAANQPAGEQSLSRAWERPEPTSTRPATPPQQPTQNRHEPVATINGRPIRRQAFLEMLKEAHGLAVLQQMMALELARQETARRGVRVTTKDIDAEYRRRLARLYPVDLSTSAELSRSQQEQALAVVLDREGVSRQEFMLKVERDAHVRRLAERDLKIDEDTLRAEYAVLYGPKVQLRMILCRSLSDVEKARELLDEGQDFAAIARERSNDPSAASTGGLTQPFSLDDASVPAVLREAARHLKPAEVSSTIRVGDQYAIIRLEREFAASEVEYSDVRDQVLQAYRRRVVPERMTRILGDLIGKARVVILDPLLRRQYEERRAASGGKAPPLAGP